MSHAAAAAAAPPPPAGSVEIRLEQSFDRADIALEVMGHRDNTAYVNLMRMMFQSICKRTGAESVWNEERAFVEARAAILEFFDQYGLTAGFKARSKHMMRETARDGARMLASLFVDDAVKRK